MRKTLLSALLVAGLSGCAASPDLPSSYALDSNKPEGLAIASLTLSGKPLEKVSGYEYRIREALPRGEAYAVVSQHYASARQHARAVWLWRWGNWLMMLSSTWKISFGD